MTHCQIILLHHNFNLVSSVIDAFEKSIINQKEHRNRISSIIQSPRKLSLFISSNTILNCDVSRIITDFVNPPLKIHEIYLGSNKSDLFLSFFNYYVKFNHYSLIDFASKHFQLKKCASLNSKTCFIQLFDQKEEKLLVNKNIYGFATRLYSSAFERSYHIHLFYDEMQCEDRYQKKAFIKLKEGNNLFISGNKLYYLISTIISQYKEPAHGISLSLIAKLKLRLNVVKEIKAKYIKRNHYVDDLVKHILRYSNKYQSYSQVRTSYVSY